MTNAVTRLHYKDNIPTAKTRIEQSLESKDHSNKLRTNLEDMMPRFNEKSIKDKAKRSDKTRKDTEKNMKKLRYTRIVKETRKNSYFSK